MKKCLSLLLILIMLTTSYGSALADTLKLPASLTKIEEEAFFGASSLDVVNIPWGTETIGSKAFANSGISAIYIPATVSSIADDAFDGTSVTIYASAGSFAEEYANLSGIPWEDCGNHYGQDTLQSALELLESEVLSESIVMDSFEFSPISTEGITDETQLTQIENLNSSLQELQKSIISYNDNVNELTSFLNGLSNEISSTTFVTNDEGISIQVEGVTYNLSGSSVENIGTDYEVVSSEILEDGSGMIMEIASNGETYYLFSDNNGTSIIPAEEATRASRNIDVLRSRSASRGENDSIVINTVLSIIKNIDTYISAISAGIDAAILSAEAAVKNAEKAIEYVAKMYGTNDISVADIYSEVDSDYTIALNRLKTFQTIKKVWSGIAFVGSIHSIYEDIQKWNELRIISQHNHPTVTDAASEEKLALIAIMKLDIKLAQYLYMCDAIMNLASIVSEIVSFLKYMSVAVPGGIVAAIGIEAMSQTIRRIIIFYGAQIVSAGVANAKYNAVKATDAKLHTYVFGTVTEKGTNKPLQGVAVTDGQVAVVTNSSGYYELYVLPGNIEILWRLKGYKDVSNRLTIEAGKALEKKVVMEEQTALIYGTAYDNKTNEKLAEVEVYVGDSTEPSTLTDENGYYSLTLPTKEVQLTFKKEGYTDYSATVTPVFEQSVKTDAPMIQQFGTVSGIVTDEYGDIVPGAKIESGNYKNGANYEGKYSITLPIGTRKIVFSKIGYESVTKTITVYEGENPLNVSLPWTYGLHGRVVDESGSPVSGATVYIFNYHDNVGYDWYNPIYKNYVTGTNENGEFRIKLNPGKYYTKTKASGFLNDTMNREYTGKEVTVLENSVTEMTVNLTDTRGKYCVPVTVRIGQYSGQPRTYFTGTISYGNYTFHFDWCNDGGNTSFYCISSSRYVDFHCNGTLYWEDGSIRSTIDETKTIDLEGKSRIGLP